MIATCLLRGRTPSASGSVGLQSDASWVDRNQGVRQYFTLPPCEFQGDPAGGDW